MEWIFIVIAALIGSIVTIIMQRMLFTSGTLRIDHNNPGKDVYRIEIDNIDALSKKKYVRLKVDNNADLSLN